MYSPNHSLIIIAALGLSGCDSKDSGATGECGKTWQVTTTDDTSDMNAYMDFSPEDLTIAVGDCVSFIMSDTHNAVEVSQYTYDSLGTEPLEGGFNVPFGDTIIVYFGEAGAHYYVCQPHAAGEMAGTITVE